MAFVFGFVIGGVISVFVYSAIVVGPIIREFSVGWKRSKMIFQEGL